MTFDILLVDRWLKWVTGNYLLITQFTLFMVVDDFYESYNFDFQWLMNVNSPKQFCLVFICVGTVAGFVFLSHSVLLLIFYKGPDDFNSINFPSELILYRNFMHSKRFCIHITQLSLHARQIFRKSVQWATHEHEAKTKKRHKLGQITYVLSKTSFSNVVQKGHSFTDC